MQQSKRHSFIEVVANIFSGMVIGFIISQLAHFYSAEIQEYIWKDFVWDISFSSNILMTSVFTVVSLIRGYVWRRIFNKIQLRKYKKGYERYETTKK